MSTAKLNEAVQTPGLYQPEFEHDNCGIGAVVNIKGVKSHGTVENALKIVENLEHRAGKDAEGKTGDGVGIMLQISHKFFSKTCESLGIFLGSEREYGKCLRSLWKKKVLNFWDGGKFRLFRKFSDTKHWNVCRVSCRDL